VRFVACARRDRAWYGWHVADSIATPHLRLLPLTPSLLRAVAGGDLAEVERQLGARVGKGWEEGVAAKLRLEQLAADPSEQPWLVRAMVASTPRRLDGWSDASASTRRQMTAAAWRSATTSSRPSAEKGMPEGDPGAARLGVGDWTRTDLRRLRQSAQRALPLPHPLVRIPACRRPDRRDRRTGTGLRAAPATRALNGTAAPDRAKQHSHLRRGLQATASTVRCAK
jgi:hypothetical protein